MAGGWRIGPSWTAPQDVGTSGAGLSQCTGGATANVLSGWQQAIAATTSDTAIIMLQFIKLGSDQSAAMDIGVGAAGSEQAVAQSLLVQQYSNAAAGWFTLPISVPKGSRIAVRCATSGGNFDSVYYRMTLFDDGALSGYGGGCAIDTYGYNAGSMMGTAVTPGATAPNKGAYAQLTGSTNYDLAGFFLVYDGQNGTGGASGDVAIDIAVGAAGSEVIIAPNCWNDWGFNQGMLLPQSPYFAIPIRAGTRISARAAAASATTYAIGLTLYGVRQ